MFSGRKDQGLHYKQFGQAVLYGSSSCVSEKAGFVGKQRWVEKDGLDAALNPDAFLRMRTVEAITALSAATIYRKLAAKGFPEPVRDGKRCTRWRAGAVQAWLAART